MKVIIVGAGPSGLFLAHKLLARSRDYQVEVLEKRDDPRVLENRDGKDFGFGLGERAQSYLKGIEGLWELVSRESVSINGGKLLLIPRRRLCGILLTLLEEHYQRDFDPALSQCSIHFKTSVVDVFLESREILSETEAGRQKKAYDLLVGADGVRSTVRNVLVASDPREYAFFQKRRPHVWKVLQLPKQPALIDKAPRLIRIQKNNSQLGGVFGAYLPLKDSRWSALIFWQPKGKDDRANPWGITTIEQLGDLLHQKASKELPVPELESESARIFLESQPSYEYWSHCHRYHHAEGSVVIFGDAAHNMFSILGQGCTAALADAFLLDCLLEKHNDNVLTALPEFSDIAVPEGQAISDLNLLALVVYHPLSRLLYGITTLVWIVLLKRPNIFVRINQPKTKYIDVLRENQFWVWLGKTLLHKSEPKK